MGAVNRAGRQAGKAIGLIDRRGNNNLLREVDPSNSLAIGGASYGIGSGNEGAGARLGLGLAPRTNQIGILDPSSKPNTPPAAPDLTDQMVRAAQRAEAMKLKTGRTRQSTFKTGGAY